MKWLWISLAGVISLAVLIVLIGALLPRNHTATRRATFRQPAEAIWKELTDIPAFPSWRSEVKSVERLPDREGRIVWREDASFGKVTFEIVESDPPRRLVVRIADPDLPFGGTWTYLLESTEGGTTVTITEDGEVRNPLFRFLSRFVFGHAASIEQYLKSLGKKFGEEVRIDG